MYKHNKPIWHNTLLKIFPLSCVKDYSISVCGKSATIRKNVSVLLFFFFPSPLVIKQFYTDQNLNRL